MAISVIAFVFASIVGLTPTLFDVSAGMEDVLAAVK